MSGDNLASQEMGGFKIGPAANLKCRECLGLSADLATKVIIANIHCGHYNFKLQLCSTHNMGIIL